jgi:hypothetical protein
MSEYYKDFQALAAAPTGLSELSVSGLQMVLEGDDLEIESEAVVFEAVRAWVRARFEGAEERSYAMAQLAPSIRFPCIPPEKLKAYSDFEEMGSEECQKLYTEALLFRGAAQARARKWRRARANTGGSSGGARACPWRACWVASPGVTRRRSSRACSGGLSLRRRKDGSFYVGVFFRREPVSGRVSPDCGTPRDDHRSVFARQREGGPGKVARCELSVLLLYADYACTGSKRSELLRRGLPIPRVRRLKPSSTMDPPILCSSCSGFILSTPGLTRMFMDMRYLRGLIG